MKTEKLELKHIKGYLDTGVTVSVNLGLISPHVKIRAIYKDKIICDLGTGIFYFDKIKLILRPLSDLTKEIKVNGEKFVPIVEILKLAHPNYFDENKQSRYSEITFEQNENVVKCCFTFQATKDIILYIKMPCNFPTWITEKLYEWHFDLFDLIENNLAIDINTLEK